MRLLVISPVASHPQDQGNSARIHGLCQNLQSMGHRVHFLYHAMEGLTPFQQAQMTSCWDAFHSLPSSREIEPPPAGAAYGLDDWYDPRLGTLARELHDRWQFDAVIVNYIWTSKALDQLPASLLKIIDTHDVFGDRHRSFVEQGLPPEWYYTTRDEERRGLMRADAVIAIQEQEAAYFRELLGPGGPAVTVVGHGMPPRFLAPREPSERPTVGYIGSANPFNVSSIRRLAAELEAQPELAARFRFVLAGSICGRFASSGPGPFDSVGRVADLEDFYSEIDLVINPMLGGTGLKIKTLEGLSFGLPVLGSADAWVGIADARALLPEAASADVVDGLRALAAEPALLVRLRERCRRAFAAYARGEASRMGQFLAVPRRARPMAEQESR